MQEVDPNIRQAIAGCEKPTLDQRVASPRMLPGWDCGVCHGPGGEAEKFTWTLSGTVFQNGTDACNPGGVEGAEVDILDKTGQIILVLTTNRSGNFFSADPLPVPPPYRARVATANKAREMMTPQMTLDCGSCHHPGGTAGARISID